MYLSSSGSGDTVLWMATIADVRRRPQERNDRWWLEDVFIVAVLGGFGLYAFVVSVMNALYFAIPVLAILWWDALLAFRFEGRFMVGLGGVIMLANVVLLSGYTLGCHAARYLVGGYLDSFHGKSLRFRLWELATKLNERHSRWAWFSLFSVAITDLYIRLCASGVIADPRLIF